MRLEPCTRSSVLVTLDQKSILQNRENFSPGDTSSFGPLRYGPTTGFKSDMLSIPLCLKDRYDILSESVWSRSRSRFDFKPEPKIGSESETKDRGHEPDPNLDPRVEDKKLCALSCFVLKTNTCVKHLQKLLVSTSKLCDVTISNVLKDASEKRPWCFTDVCSWVVSNTLPFWVQVSFDTGFSLFFPPTLTTMTQHTPHTTWYHFNTTPNKIPHLTLTQTQHISKDTPSILPSRIISWPLYTNFHSTMYGFQIRYVIHTLMS